MNKERNLLYTGIAFIIIILLLASYIYVSYKSSNQNEGEGQSENYETWGSLEFPKDEGVHKSVYETYAVYMNLTDEHGKTYYFMLQWNTNFENNVLHHGAELLYTNSENGKTTVAGYSDKEFNSTESSNKSLDLKWKTKDGPFYLERFSGKEIEKGNYRVLADAKYKNYSFHLDLRVVNSRFPALFGLNGTGDMGNFGTVYGYFHTDLYAAGSVEINGDTASVTGKVMMSHMWGFVYKPEYSPSPYMDTVFMKMPKHDIMLLRFYLNPNSLNWEYFYVVNDKNYTVFVTHKDKTIGASVSPTEFKDLAGESYDAYVVDYFKDPHDNSGKRCYPYRWYVKSYYENYSGRFWPIYPYTSPEIGAWEGFMTGKDENGNGWGAANLFNPRNSVIRMKNISTSAMENGTINVTENIRSNLPIILCNLSYNISFSNGTYLNDTVMPMERLSDTEWYANIKGLENVKSIDIRVIVEDNAYTVKTAKTTVEVQK